MQSFSMKVLLPLGKWHLLLGVLYIEFPWQLSWSRICLQCRRPQFDSWVRKILWRRDRPLTPVFLGFPGELVKNPPANAGDLDSIPGWKDPLKKGKATHSSILSWKSPWGCKELDMTERLSLSRSLYYIHYNKIFLGFGPWLGLCKTHH